MKKKIFLYEEILGITAGKLRLIEIKDGVPIEFIEYFMKKLNQYILLENKEVQFILPYSLEDKDSVFYNMNNSAYEYDTMSKVFRLKEGMLYEFFAHWEVAEYRVVEALSGKTIIELSQGEIIDFQIKAKKLLDKVFYETKEKFFN